MANAPSRRVRYAGRVLAGFYGMLTLLSFLAVFRDAESGVWFPDVDARDFNRVGVLLFAALAAYLFSKGRTWGYYGLCLVCASVTVGGVLLIGAASLAGDGIDWRHDLPASLPILLFIGAHAYVLILLLTTSPGISEPVRHEGGT